MMMRFISYLEMFYSTFQRWKLIRGEGLAFSYILTSTLKYEEEEKKQRKSTNRLHGIFKSKENIINCLGARKKCDSHLEVEQQLYLANVYFVGQ